MYKLLLAILLLAMPTEGLATLTVSNCDAGTLQCQCTNSLESETVDSLPDDTASCTSACEDYATSESVSWTLRCTIDGDRESITSGTIDGPESVAADTETSGCESGTIECYCTDGPSAGEIEGKTTVDTCQSACDSSGGSSITLTCVVGGTITEVYATEVAVEEVESRDPIIPNLNVDLPGLTFTPPTISGGSISVNFIGEYINALYRFAIPAMTIVAIVMMMIAGLQYILARGNMGAITKAKARISNAVVGLVILFSAYTLAYLVSPDTVAFDTLTFQTIQYEDYGDSLDAPSSTGGVVDTSGVSSNIKCGTEYSLSEMAYSTVGRVTYRTGGKVGKIPPYSDTAVDPSGVAYKTYCPTGQMCLDCSGYAAMLLACAGMPSAGGSTAEMFNDATLINAGTVTDTSINGMTLQPGDLIGAPGWHVVIYIGDGKIAESHGGSGRITANAINAGKDTVSSYISQAKRNARSPQGSCTKRYCWGTWPLYFKRP